MKHSWWIDNLYHCTCTAVLLLHPYINISSDIGTHKLLLLVPFALYLVFMYNWLIAECNLLRCCPLKVCYMYYMTIKLFSFALSLSFVTNNHLNNVIGIRHFDLSRKQNTKLQVIHTVVMCHNTQVRLLLPIRIFLYVSSSVYGVLVWNKNNIFKLKYKNNTNGWW